MSEPDTNGLPTEEEIATLPRRAIVAFAARCARRVQPLFKAKWPGAREEGYCAAVDRAITLSEQIAATADANAGTDTYLAANPAQHAAANAAGAHAAHAAHAAEAAVDAAVGDHAANAHAAANAANDAGGVGAHAIRCDFELLRHAAAHLDWTDDTPVPPEFYGPLWPMGIPDGWPRPSEDELPEQPQVLKLEIATPVGMSKQESEAFDAKLVELFAAMTVADVRMGGNGLRILDECSDRPAPVEREIPQFDRKFVGVRAVQ